MGTSVIYTKNRQISLKDLNKKFLIYNGKDFQKLVISQSMIGHNFGGFMMDVRFQIFHLFANFVIQEKTGEPASRFDGSVRNGHDFPKIQGMTTF